MKTLGIFLTVFCTLSIIASIGYAIKSGYEYDKDFGSSDANLIGIIQESITITSDGQTAFQLSNNPSDITTVMLFARGIKLTYGVDYTVGGPGLNDNDVTHIPSFPTNPPLETTDSLEAWYVA